MEEDGAAPDMSLSYKRKVDDSKEITDNNEEYNMQVCAVLCKYANTCEKEKNGRYQREDSQTRDKRTVNKTKQNQLLTITCTTVIHFLFFFFLLLLLNRIFFLTSIPSSASIFVIADIRR